jgi:hypothetical protein
MINMDHLQQFIDLRRADIDPEVFAAALTILSISKFIGNGGSSIGEPDLETALHPPELEAFLARAVETAQKNKRFEQEWRRLQQVFPPVKVAWENGRMLFQEDLARATDNPKEMEYLSQRDFATDCYARSNALKTYPHDRALQAWVVNGYMLAWRQHFLTQDDISQ